MALYESNYLRMLRLIPELHRLDGYYRSNVAGDCDLHVEILERSRYTVTLSLSLPFVAYTPYWPPMIVRLLSVVLSASISSNT